MMELRLLRENQIWIRSEDDELYLVRCDSDGNLIAEQTQPRQRHGLADNHKIKKEGVD